ncbi:tyrosine-type recombinase/integrase [Frankia sp. BMG5.23]|uniref:tyrosine-type recombinase/integrase n=1 Tax=Frankia sp. BMG5.23 TaxID=683305 RepID=UPI0005BA7F1E|nr:tyrosine-type recombinase/integrase [Frankia sp. BMG5.23]
MTGLRAALGDYLTLRRAFGFGLAREEKLLAQFLDFLEQRGTGAFTIDDVLDWVTAPAKAGPSWLRMRMGAVRGFAGYLHTLDPAVPVPPPGLFAKGSSRAVPYLYSDADIAALMAAADTLRYSMTAATYRTLIGLLTVTGIRIGEAARLDDSDFDPDAGLLTVRASKNGRSRQLPLHPTTVAALRAYQHTRDAIHPQPISPALLVSNPGSRLLTVSIDFQFRLLAARVGLTARPGGARPRPHDTRHSFAVATLLGWYRDGGDVAARLPLLSAYLGHADPKNTYWYLDAAPELLAEAARRLETRPPGGSPPSDRGGAG